MQKATAFSQKRLYDAEWQIGRQLKGLAEADAAATEPELAEIEKTLAAVEADTGIAYDATQRKAIVTALQVAHFLLTGGTGYWENHSNGWYRADVCTVA